MLMKIVLLLFFAVIGICYGEYEEDKCYCFDELDDDLKMQQEEFQPIEEEIPKYSYYGVLYTGDNYYKRCLCHDVTRIVSPYVFKDKEAQIKVITNTGKNNITKDLINYMTQFSKDHSDIIMNLAFEYDKVSEDNETIYQMEMVLKGHNEQEPTFILTNLMKTGQILVDYYGFTDAEKFNVTILRCSEEPPTVVGNGTIEWSQLYFPGVKAVYSCVDGYVVENVDFAFTECSHDTLTWSHPLENITCSPGCSAGNPPSIRAAIANFDMNNRKEGSKTIYTCTENWIPENGRNGTSICRNGNWTELVNFKCKMQECSKQIPQVPSNALVKNYDSKMNMYVDQQFNYTCIETYCSSYDNDVQTECQQNGEWSPLPEDFGCFTPIKTRCPSRDMLKRIQLYETHSNKHVVVEYENRFFTVTTPFIIGIGVFMLLMLALFMPSSPIYRCCGDAKKANYQTFF